MYFLLIFIHKKDAWLQKVCKHVMYIIIISKNKYFTVQYVEYFMYYYTYTVYQQCSLTTPSPTLNPKLPHLKHESPTSVSEKVG